MAYLKRRPMRREIALALVRTLAWMSGGQIMKSTSPQWTWVRLRYALRRSYVCRDTPLRSAGAVFAACSNNH